jgi:hypothetical protein
VVSSTPSAVARLCVCFRVGLFVWLVGSLVGWLVGWLDFGVLGGMGVCVCVLVCVGG